ncbi:MAG: glycosyltransferase family 4 protein [Sphingobium sp.]
MRIIIDMQGLQSPFSAGRGVGRYTEALVKNLLIENGRARKHEIILALNGAFPDAVLDVRRRFKGLVDPQHFVVWQQFFDPNARGRPHPAIVKAAQVSREIFLNSFTPDLIFSTNLQEGLSDPSVTGVRTIPSSALYCSALHDLVPYFHPEYIADRVTGDWYRGKIEAARNSDILLTMSETVRQQIMDKVGIAPERVVAIHNGVDTDIFNSLPMSRQARDAVLARLGVAPGYLFYFGGCEKHKNLERLVRAYALVRRRIPDAPPLVLAGRDVADAPHFDTLIASLDLSGHVKRPGFIADSDLPDAIKCAVGFLFPCRYEGFGLPALEAMACGTATLGAKGSSVAEIIGDDSALFDGEDEEGMAALIVKLLEDKDWREALAGRAAVRAADFSWEKAAKAFLRLLDSVKPPTGDDTVDPVEQLSDGLFWEWPAFSQETKAAIAHSVAESLPVSRRPRIYLDISAVDMHDVRPGIDRVSRAICQELLNNSPSGYDVIPVYSMREDVGFCVAKDHMSGVGTVPPEDEAHFQNGDILLYLGLDPGIAIATREYSHYLRVKGVTVYHVVHDLLPLLCPAGFRPELCDEFRDWIGVVSGADGAVCVSRAVADELKDYLSVYGEKRADDFLIGWFHPGADMASSAPTKGMPSDAGDVLGKVEGLRSFLMVGTVEPRKGYRQTLDAFEALWKTPGYENVALFIVGRPGWGMDDFAGRLKAHPELGKRLFWLPGISDEYLEAVYQRCHCLIAASDGEGFGLPLIEAARRGKPMILRDIPVFREVAGDHACFFDNDPDPAAIATAVKGWMALFDKARHPASTSMSWLKWKDSAAQLADVILKDKWVHKVSSQGSIAPRARIACDSRQVKWFGFAPPEANGRLIRDRQARIEFRWGGSESAHFRMLVGSVGAPSVTVALNGVEQYSDSIEGDDRLVALDMTGLRDGLNVIDLHLSDAGQALRQDARRSALSLRYFQIVTPVHLIMPDMTIGYRDHGVEWDRFGDAEDGFRWSIGHRARLGFFWGGGAGEFLLELGAVGYGSQAVALSCNGRSVYSGQLLPGRPGDPAATGIQCKVWMKPGYNAFAFHFPDAISPGPEDARQLGMAIDHFRISHPVPAISQADEMVEN